MKIQENNFYHFLNHEAPHSIFHWKINEINKNHKNSNMKIMKIVKKLKNQNPKESQIYILSVMFLCNFIWLDQYKKIIKNIFYILSRKYLIFCVFQLKIHENHFSFFLNHEAPHSIFNWKSNENQWKSMKINKNHKNSNMKSMEIP